MWWEFHQLTQLNILASSSKFAYYILFTFLRELAVIITLLVDRSICIIARTVRRTVRVTFIRADRPSDGPRNSTCRIPWTVCRIVRRTVRVTFIRADRPSDASVVRVRRVIHPYKRHINVRISISAAEVKAVSWKFRSSSLIDLYTLYPTSTRHSIYMQGHPCPLRLHGRTVRRRVWSGVRGLGVRLCGK
jgi:hypothetical protein